MDLSLVVGRWLVGWRLNVFVSCLIVVFFELLLMMRMLYSGYLSVRSERMDLMYVVFLLYVGVMSVIGGVYVVVMRLVRFSDFIWSVYFFNVEKVKMFVYR